MRTPLQWWNSTLLDYTHPKLKPDITIIEFSKSWETYYKKQYAPRPSLQPQNSCYPRISYDSYHQDCDCAKWKPKDRKIQSISCHYAIFHGWKLRFLKQVGYCSYQWFVRLVLGYGSESIQIFNAVDMVENWSLKIWKCWL